MSAQQHIRKLRACILQKKYTRNTPVPWLYVFERYVWLMRLIRQF